MSTTETGLQRLQRSRAQVVHWIDGDIQRREAFSHSGLGQFASLPFIRRISGHPLAGVAMSVLTKWWMKPRAATSSTMGVLALGTGWKLLRRRPLLTLGTAAVVGAVAWWAQRRPAVRIQTTKR